MNLKILGCEGEIILLHCRYKEVCDFNCFQSPIQEAQLFLRFQTLFNSSYYCFHIVYSLFVSFYFFNCLKCCDLKVFKYYSSLRIILSVFNPYCLSLFLITLFKLIYNSNVFQTFFVYAFSNFSSSLSVILTFCEPILSSTSLSCYNTACLICACLQVDHLFFHRNKIIVCGLFDIWNINWFFSYLCNFYP